MEGGRLLCLYRQRNNDINEFWVHITHQHFPQFNEHQSSINQFMYPLFQTMNFFEIFDIIIYKYSLRTYY
jgi:hypothetical protein